MKVLNITHTDLDGVGCSLVLQVLYGKDNVECQHTGYGNVDKKVEKAIDRINNGEDLIVYITDICFKKNSGLAEQIEQVNKDEIRIRVLDHHATSCWINEYPWGTSYEVDSHDRKTCGTKWTLIKMYSLLTSDRCFESSIQDFVSLVNEWDTWRWVTDYPYDQPNEKAKHLNMLLSIYGLERFKEVFYEKLINNKELFDETDQLLLELKQNEIDADVKSKDSKLVVMSYWYRTTKKDEHFVKDYIHTNHLNGMDYLKKVGYHKRFNIGVTFADRNISEVGNELNKLHPELDFIVLVSLPNTLSFRTTKDLPVPMGIIANHMTKGYGGGHPQSAGGIIVGDTINNIVKSLIY